MRGFVVVFGIALLAAGLVVGLQSAQQETSRTETVENETFDPQAEGPEVTFDQSFRADVLYEETVTVRNQTGDVVSEPDAYEWRESNGTLRVTSGGNLDQAGTANITYAYDVSSADQIRMANLLALLPQALGLALPVLVVVLFLRVLV